MRWMVAIAIALLAANGARADTVPPFKGNDTGGIISDNLVGYADIRGLAVTHCARYGKIARFVGDQRRYGGYISFACKWVPVGVLERPIRTLY